MGFLVAPTSSILLVCSAALLLITGTFAARDPTVGFTALTLTESNFKVQKPYDEPLNQRYSFIDGVHKLWVYSTDKPHFPGSNTRPRTEIRIEGYDYSSGVWQFEGYGYVPSGTTGVSVMQVFGAVGHATTLMCHVYDGSLKYYDHQILEENIYDRWFKLNVIHDVDASNVKIFVDDDLKYEGPDHGGSHHFFKFGVYTQSDPSNYMESRWRDIKVLRKE